jgi:hypothetical protein|eukprot:COSAG01_NODE_6454_length_3659_cov_3.918258_4_plen_282_part_00
MTKHAFNDGAEYIARLNDDTELISQGWITMAIKALSEMHPPNVGVVGPAVTRCPTAANGAHCMTDILTHDFVHRTHLLIFDNYYPRVFASWFVDDWITKVYQPHRMKVITKWQVAHLIVAHGTRYAPVSAAQLHVQPPCLTHLVLQERALEKRLTPELTRGKRKIDVYLRSLQPYYRQQLEMQLPNSSKPALCGRIWWASVHKTQIFPSARMKKCWDTSFPCCHALTGICGGDEAHCLCEGCIDFSLREGLGNRVTGFARRVNWLQWTLGMARATDRVGWW